MSKVKIYSDGGARGNPGPAATGWLIYVEDELVDFGGTYIGDATNNIAEYSALQQALATVTRLAMKQKLQIEKIICHLDSELVVKQLNGEYKIKNEDLQKMAIVIKLNLKNFTDYKIQHIPREQNKLADKLVNMNLDSVLK
jgi:ribonuclease HI